MTSARPRTAPTARRLTLLVQPAHEIIGPPHGRHRRLERTGGPLRGLRATEHDRRQPPTPGDQADVGIDFFSKGVLTNALADYTGELRAEVPLQITDKDNTPHPGGPGAATTQEFTFDVDATCAVVPEPSPHSECQTTTTADALIPGAIKEGRRSIWQLGQVRRLRRRPRRGHRHRRQHRVRPAGAVRHIVPREQRRCWRCSQRSSRTARRAAACCQRARMPPSLLRTARSPSPHARRQRHLHRQPGRDRCRATSRTRSGTRHYRLGLPTDGKIAFRRGRIPSSGNRDG